MKRNKLTLAISQIIGIGLLGMHNVNAGVDFVVSSTSGTNTAGVLTSRVGSNILVDTVAFNTASDGFCSLPEAVNNANFDNNNFSDCAPGNGADNIGFSPSLNGETITATNVLSLSSEITFDGPGANQLALSGNDTSQIFDLSSSATVTINGLSLINGYAVYNGGAINNDYGHLTINKSKLNNNTALNGGGAIYSNGSLILNRVSMNNNHASNRGGAVYHNNSATLLQVNQSNFTNNFTSQSPYEGGGAINIRGPSATISQSSFVGNTASLNGGAIHQRFEPVTIINSTFSNNKAGGNGGAIATIFNGAITNIINSTFSGNSTVMGDGASIYTLETLHIINSILAGNGSTNECIATTIGNNINNLVEDGSCNSNANNPLTGDPMLLALANNGGFTLTHMPMVGSPVIDAGSNISCVMIDQRNHIRPQDGDGNGTIVCDIGAVEVANPDVVFKNSFEN